MRIFLLALTLVACGSDDSSEGGGSGGSAQGGTGGSSGGSAGTGSTGGASGGVGGASGGSGGAVGGSGGAVGGNGGSGGSVGGSGGSGGGSGGALGSGALRFVENAANAHEYARHTVIPGNFGAAEFTLEVRITLQNGASGDCSGGAAQLANWCIADNAPYSSSSWWYEGNFLLDGHNNSSFGDGTFSLQMYGTGRIRWLFGDGAVNQPGGVWSIGAYPSGNVTTLLDQQAHLITLVRRFTAATDSTLELWIDGTSVASEISPARPNMRQWWDSWPGFPTGQSGWFWGSEKQAAIGVLSQYEDFKGLLHEVRFWSIARSTTDIATSPSTPVLPGAPGLVGLFDFDEGSGNQACDSVSSACMTLNNATASIWAP